MNLPPPRAVKLLGLLFVLISGTTLLLPTKLDARDLTVSLGKIPGRAEMNENGVPTGDYVRLFHLIDKAYKEGSLTIGVFPFARSVNNLEQDKADIHFPIIRPLHNEDFPFTFVPEPVFNPVFVLYSRTDKPLGPEDDLSTKRIETVGGSRTKSYKFPVAIAANPEAGLRKVSLGRIDGYIGEQNGTDRFLRKLGLDNIHRELFSVVDLGIATRNSDDGKQLAEELTIILRELKKDPEIRSLLSSIYGPFQENLIQ